MKTPMKSDVIAFLQLGFMIGIVCLAVILFLAS